MDHLLVLGFAVVWPLAAVRGHARFVARVRAGVPGARLAAYAEATIIEWLLVALAVALWIHADRDFTCLGLVAPASRDGYLALAVAVVIGALLAAQSGYVARRPETHTSARAAMARIVEVLPVHRSDLTGFIALSLTAGVCEEILFRGYLGWYLGEWLGPWGAQAVAVPIFAAAHLYGGIGGALRALAAGAVFAALYLWSGSLLPSILLHAVVDLTSGWMAYEVLRERPAAASS
jgi:membrane protease YdiL (CAAX protease family)